VKQIFYLIAVVVLLIIAQRVMAKIKDAPDNEPDIPDNESEEEPMEENEENIEK
jgi:hypothetical protein